jgi:FtsZ-binding cell division protein ZapB
MDPRELRANEFVLPGDDADNLVDAARSALAVVPALQQMIDALHNENRTLLQGRDDRQQQTIDTLQDDNRTLRQAVQNGKDAMTALMLHAKEAQAQVTTQRFAPVLPTLAAETGVLVTMPSMAMKAVTLSRETSPEGKTVEHLSITFDPADLIRARGEATLNGARGEAKINHSRSWVAKLTGREEDY